MSIILKPGVCNIHRNMATMAGVIESQIRSKLLSQLEAKHLDVINESYMHNVPKGSETHFKVVVVSPKFEGLPLIKACIQTSIFKKDYHNYNQPNTNLLHVPNENRIGGHIVTSRLTVKSEKLSRRHRLINDILKEELQTGVHALSIMAKTPQQWDESDQNVESSPSCKGGFGK